MKTERWVGEDFREWRRGLELTQAKTALLLDLSERTVRYWEKRMDPLPRFVMLACRHVAANPHLYPELYREPDPGKRLIP